MRILALTSIRSDYDLMSGVYARLAGDPDVDFRLLVSGAHLSPTQGMTVGDIRADGFAVLAEVPSLAESDAPAGRLRTASALLQGCIGAVEGFAPDVILFAGDREDVLVGAMLGAYLGIPTAHFFAGDHATDGHVDNPVRHAASKLASAHFVSLPEHRDRLRAIGEPARRIFVIGSVALDKFVDEPPMDAREVRKRLGAGPHAGTHPLAVFIFHPLAEEREQAADIVRETVEALVARGLHVCIGRPNTDPGHLGVAAALERFSGREEVTIYGNLPRGCFVNLLRGARLLAGNSSAGLLEAPSIPLAAVNIGRRQRGRRAAGNVVFADGDGESVRAAIDTALSPGFQQDLRSVVNPYGDGRSAHRACELLKTIDFPSLLRKPEDPLRPDHEH